MKKRILYILLIGLTIVLAWYSVRKIMHAPSYSLNSISDINKRNENWCWYVPEGKTIGEWRMTGGNDNPPDGKYTFFYCNGNLSQQQTIHDGNKCDTTFTYDLKGNLQEYTTYKNDKPLSYYLHNGAYKDYGTNCALYLTGNVKNHDRIGEWIWFKSYEKKDFSENYLDSITTIRIEYYDSGQMKDSGRTVNHKPEGVIKYWYENGNLEQACSWIKGLQDGPAIFYNENGKLKSKTNWKQGKRHGESIVYSENGILYKKIKYIEGQKVASSELSKH